MNQCVLMGRTTRDPEVRYTQQGMCIARYTLAVDRRPQPDGTRQADFINCTVFGKLAEVTQKYVHQGMRLTVSGRIQTGSYTDKDGRKVYTTDVIVEDQEFAESKATTEARLNQQAPQQGYQAPPQQNYQQQSLGEGWMQIPDGLDDAGLPWNN